MNLKVIQSLEPWRQMVKLLEEDYKERKRSDS